MEENTPLETNTIKNPLNIYDILRKFIIWFFILLFVFLLGYLLFINGKSIYENGL